MVRRLDGLYVPMRTRDVELPDDIEVGAWLAWSQVRDEPLDRDALYRSLGRVSRDWLLRSLSMVGALLANGGGLLSRDQRAMAAELLTGEDRDKALRLFDSGDVMTFVHPDGLLIAVKLALRYGSPTEPTTDSEALASLLLASNELAGAPDGVDLDHLAGTALHSSALDQTEQLRYLIPRYQDLLVERGPAAAASLGFDPTEAFLESTGGLSIDDYTAFAVAVWAGFSTFKRAQDLQARPFGRVVPDTAARAHVPEAWELFERLVVCDIADAAEVVAAGEDTPVAFDEFDFFRSRPLMRLYNGEVVPIWLPWLNAKLGDGLRWTIQGPLRGDQLAINRFTAALGQWFEDYAFELLARVYPASGPFQILYPAHAYAPRGDQEESNDATLFLGDAAFFFEFTITAPRAVDLWTGDAALFREFVAERLVSGRNPKLAKLERRIRDFLAGDLVIDSIHPNNVHRLYPILVTLTPWPRHKIVSMALAPVLAPLDLLSGDTSGEARVFPLRWISAEELEMLEGPLLTGAATFEFILSGWAASPRADSSLKNYLFFDLNLAEVPNPYLREGYWAFVDRLRAGLAGRLHLDDQRPEDTDGTGL